MKRKQYLITSTAGHNVVKFAWNSAHREIERLVGEMANSEQVNYHLTNKEWVKDGYEFISGFREWTSSKNVVTFYVALLPD